MDLFSPPPDVVALRARAWTVHARLCAVHGCPVPFFSDKDPLSELVSALLSHRTRNEQSARACRQPRRRFPTWPAVRDAPVSEVEAAIAPCTWPEHKAPRIQAGLQAITDAPETEVLSLDALADWPARQARRWLEQFHGVGPKTSAAVLLFGR